MGTWILPLVSVCVPLHHYDVMTQWVTWVLVHSFWVSLLVTVHKESEALVHVNVSSSTGCVGLAV